MRSRAIVGVIVALAAATHSAGCDPCAPPDDTALDYADPSSWACHPERGDGPCHDDLDAESVQPDGSVVLEEHEAAADPAFDCFYIYPTLDLATTPGVHTSFASSYVYDETTRLQAARLTQSCAVYAPHYRQVTLGTYFRDPVEVEGCFAVALGDVKRAFARFLDDAGGERPFVVYGHSQGGQHSLSLLRDVIAPDDELAARLLAVFAIGWPFYVGDDGSDAFGSGAAPCSSASETGCVVSYRSFVDGNELPAARYGRPAGGSSVACTEPSSTGRLDSYVRAEAGQGAPFARYRDLYAASCAEEGDNAALAVSYAPLGGDVRDDVLDLEERYRGANGAHLIDVQLTMGDLSSLVEEKAAAFAAGDRSAD